MVYFKKRSYRINKDLNRANQKMRLMFEKISSYKATTIDAIINKNFAKYAKFALMATAYIIMTYVENNGKVLLIEHGLIQGDALQITKYFFTLNFGALPTGIKEGLAQIAFGYAYVGPVDIYLGTSGFRWVKKKSYEFFGPDHYLNKSLTELIIRKNR